jgi:threonine synthase
MEIFQQQFLSLKNKVSSCSISDAATKDTLLSVFKEQNYLCDPHGVVAYKALQDYLLENPNDKGIFLETAHPVKFYDVVEPIINQAVPIPESIKGQLLLDKKSTKIGVGANGLKSFLLEL